MELQRSCKEAIASCLDQKTFAVATYTMMITGSTASNQGIFSSLISMKATI